MFGGTVYVIRLARDEDQGADRVRAVIRVQPAHSPAPRGFATVPRCLRP